MADFKFKENGNTDDRLTAKYPYYVWHKSKRLQPTQALTAFQDREEDNMISITCSEYLQEAVEMIELEQAGQDEDKQSNEHKMTSALTRNDLERDNPMTLDRNAYIR